MDDDDKKTFSADEQALAFKLEEMLHSILADSIAPVRVKCNLLVEPGQSSRQITCRVECKSGDIGIADKLLVKEMNVIARDEQVAELSIEMHCVIPAIVRYGIALPSTYSQMFVINIVANDELPEEVSPIPVQTREPEQNMPATDDINYGKATSDYDHVIVLVHGIKDVGAWQSTVSRELANEGTTVAQIRFGLYSALRFLFPINLSGKAVKRVAEGIRDVKSEYSNAKISVIAHSCGSYVVLRAMKKDPNLEFWKIVFCGSVADDQLRWVDFRRRVGDRIRPTRDFIVNDCGTGDCWPIIGAAFGWFYGMAGSTGFSEGMLVNRFHRGKDGKAGGHGLYFDRDFVREQWRPFLIEDKAPKGGDGIQGEHIPFILKSLYHGWVRVLCKLVALAIWLLIAASLIGGAIWLWKVCCPLFVKFFGD